MQPTYAIADEAIEAVLEPLPEAQAESHQSLKDSLALQTRRETIMHTARWQQKFAAFLLHLTAVV